jgi:hypothetical protein
MRRRVSGLGVVLFLTVMFTSGVKSFDVRWGLS